MFSNLFQAWEYFFLAVVFSSESLPNDVVRVPGNGWSLRRPPSGHGELLCGAPLREPHQVLGTEPEVISGHGLEGLEDVNPGLLEGPHSSSSVRPAHLGLLVLNGIGLDWEAT